MKQLNKVLRILLPNFILERSGFLVHRKQLFVRGTWPLWRAQKSLQKSAKEPNTFSEKILYKMAFDRRDLLATFANKLDVRRYVEEHIGREYLTDLYAVLNSKELDSFKLNDFPRNFAIKVNHASGGIILVNDRESRVKKLPNENEIISMGWSRFSIHPDNFDWNLVKLMLTKWLKMNRYWTPGHFPEWAYRDIEPKVMIEELLRNEVGEINDFRFFTFNGKCEFISTGPPFYSQSSTERNFYTLDWELIPVRGKYPNVRSSLERPRNLDEMIRVSEFLATRTDHVRVDLYSLNQRICFGEMTNYHSAGAEILIPDSFNYEFGRSWRPETLY
jgi:TupA-like ATPgrasp